MVQQLSKNNSRRGSRRNSVVNSENIVDMEPNKEETIQWKKGNILGKGAFGTVRYFFYSLNLEYKLILFIYNLIH